MSKIDLENIIVWTAGKVNKKLTISKFDLILNQYIHDKKIKDLKFKEIIVKILSENKNKKITLDFISGKGALLLNADHDTYLILKKALIKFIKDNSCFKDNKKIIDRKTNKVINKPKLFYMGKGSDSFIRLWKDRNVKSKQ